MERGLVSTLVAGVVVFGASVVWAQDYSSSKDHGKIASHQVIAGELVGYAANAGMKLERGGHAEMAIVPETAPGDTAQLPSAPVRILVLDRDHEKVTFDLNGKVFYISNDLAKTLERSEKLHQFDLNPPQPDNVFHWKKAFLKSEFLIAGMNGVRLTEADTRFQLFHGKYFAKVGAAYSDDFKGGWGDGDSTFTNYVRHPFGGGIYAQIWCDADPKCVDLDFGFNKNYFVNGFLKPMGWSALMSLNFENGPISESTIGAVGYNKARDGHYGMVDYFVTPMLGIFFKTAGDVWHTKVRKPFDEREANAFREYNRSIEEMIRTNTLTEQGMRDAEKKIPSGFGHKLAAVFIRGIGDYNRTVSSGLEFKSGLRNSQFPR